MSDTIVVASNYGDVILLSGKCWSLVGTTTADVTHGSPVSAYSTCSGCIAGNSPLDPPSGISLSMGDVHYVYGIPATIAADPTSASFNVDDNISNTEIVWWTHTEGGVEYVVLYEQQDFTFTAGGKAIDQIIVSASDLSIVDTYTVTTPTQSATLRDGGAWVNGGLSALGTAMEFNVTERIIEPDDCCNIQATHFGMFNLTVQPATGFKQIEEYGGALWYIWKQVGTAYGSGAVNNPSSASFDGIGTFLSGIDGYNARSQFETSDYGSVRELYDQADVDSVMSKLDELASINGTWDADWDPLAQDPMNCPMATCGTPNADPTVLMTLTWTDSDVSKNYLGCTWCNGETKELYADTYLLNTTGMTSTTDLEESWVATNGGLERLFMRQLSGAGAHSGIGSIVGFGAGLYFSNNYNIIYNHATMNISTDNINEYNIEAFSSRIQDAYFGQITTTAGIEIVWTRGNGW